MRDEPIKPDWPADTKFVGVYRERQVDAAQRLYGAMGVERRDLVARKLAYVRNHAFFDAPHVVFVFMPEPFDTREATDIGMYAQTLMLALAARGIASCAQGALGLFPDIVREQLGVASQLQTAVRRLVRLRRSAGQSQRRPRRARRNRPCRPFPLLSRRRRRGASESSVRA